MVFDFHPLRVKAGLTVMATAQALGITHAAYLFWEHGKTLPTADKLPAIAELFGCSLEDLYYHGDDDTHISIPEGGAEDNGAKVQEYL